ncbi:MAG: segregation/condensation protein A [Armatimonadota bacterium]|nr:MAG: segregation/condensation protein A [Armatimonadota bacterium]
MPDTTAHSATAHSTAPPDRVFTGHPVKLPPGNGTSAFEGPLDLLLYLIARDEIDIFDIPIEHITAQYLDYLATLETLNIEVAGEFLVMASQLLEIKSRMLLPQPEQPQEDDEEAGDPRAALVARLIEYRRYKAVADELRARAELQRLVFSRRHLVNGNGNGNGHHWQPGFGERPYLMLNQVSSFDLWAAFQTVLSRAAEAPTGGELIRPRFTVGQKIAAIVSRLRWTTEGIRFVDLFDEGATRLELIVTFLALLELIRLRRVRVAQDRLFGEIRVHAIEKP